MNDFVPIPLFSTPIVVTNIDREFTKNELNCIADIPIWKENQQMANHRSKDVYLFDNFVEELKDIKIFIEQQLKRYLEEIEGVDTNLATLRITLSWLNITKPNESHHPHFHQNSYLSGVIYISCLPNDQIYFSNRIHGFGNNIEFPMNKNTIWNVGNIAQNVIEGDLILFPSWVPHYVRKNTTKRERISLSFNTFPIGEMGKYPGTHLIL